MTAFNITLNIYLEKSLEKWDALVKVYEAMPGWLGFVSDGCPTWTVTGNPQDTINASVEPGGLHFFGNVPEQALKQWMVEFIDRASEVLGYQVYDSEGHLAEWGLVDMSKLDPDSMW
jgi:hypothetical protein